MLSLFDAPPVPAVEPATPKKRTRRSLRAAEYLLLAVGFVCLGIFAYNWAETYIYQSYEEYQLESAMKGRPDSLFGYLKYVAQNGSEPQPKTSGEDDDAYRDLAQTAPGPAPAPVRPRAVDGLIGRIEIPRVNVTAIVREGVDATVLRRAAGHVPGTAQPGEDGNVAVAAHRDSFFRGLRDIRMNDRIRMVTPTGTYEYQVRSTDIVQPSDVQVLDPQRKREMTLITCYPFNYVGHAPKRFIVRAEEVSAASAGAAPAADAQAAQPLPQATKPATAKQPERFRKSSVKPARKPARRSSMRTASHRKRNGVVERLQLSSKRRALQSE